jgi:hypothetical protein
MVVKEKGVSLLRKTVSIIMLIVLLLSAPPLVFAAKFNLGDTVEVFNTGASGLVVRDAPAGNAIGKKYDGNRGMVLAGPQSASLGGVFYTWWKVRWGDDALEGWSAEGYPGGVDYLKKVSVSPSTKFSIGNLVKVSTGGPSLIVRTDPPPSSDLSYKGSVADGTVGKVVGGPFYGVPQGASGFYHFWKVDYLSIVGWSAEDWLTKVVGEPTITSSLRLESPPYYVGNTITARFTITNRASASFTFDVLTVGGRDPDNQVADFTWVRSITLSPSSSYNYQGTLTLTKVGNYHFFCAYRTPWGDWNTAVPTEGGATNTLDIYVNPTPTPQKTLTVYSSPSGVTFTVDGASRTTPWSATYSQGASVSLVMPSTHSVGAIRYYWDRWSDGITSRSRTVTMNTDITLTAYFTGPYYQLTVTSSPITGIPFTINGAPTTTSYTEWLLQGSYTIEMPATYSGYTWSHWLEDDDTNRIKTFTLSSTKTLTAVYTTAPPPNQPPNKPTAVSQYRSDGVTVIPEEGATPESTVVFKATVSDPDGDSVRLEIELRQIGEAFTGEPTPETISDFVPSGSQVTITRYDLVDGSYKWQYRAKDSKGATSSWVEFETQGNIDFIISEDVYWLAKAIASEAGSVYDNSLGKWVQCSDEERISVGWTVLNRLYSGRFQNSIKAIVTSGAYAYNQEPTKEIENLAKKLLEGEIPDPTNGATHFFSPIKWETHPDPRIYGPYKISGTDESVFIPYWAIPIGYSEASPPPPDWEITPFYKTIDFPTTEWVSGITNVRNRYFMFYRPYITEIAAEVGSPVELRVYDSQGRVTGLVNGTVTIEIPASDYFQNSVTIFFPNDTYRFVVAGTTEGFYGLTVTAVTRQENITFSAIELPTAAEAIHQYTIDWSTLSLGEEGVTVMVDSDGDGTFEHTFTSDSELTQGEFLAQIALYTFSIVWGEETFIVSVESNSTVSNFAFNQPCKEISFNVTGEVGTIGFCNVTIPKALLYGEPWTVLIDGAPVPATITENATHSCLYFTYTHSTHTIQIIGTWVIGPPPDTTPPLIGTPSQEPDKVTPDQAVRVSVSVTDMESGVKNVILSYTTNGGATWNNLTMLYNATVGLYQAVIPAFPSGTNVCYKIIAYDNADNVAINDNAGQYYRYIVSPLVPPPSVSISPLSASILVGQSVTFTSTVSGGYTPYSYQWYLNGNPVSGATSNTWTFTPTTSGIYYVHLKVTDAKANTAQSETGRITVATVPVGGYSFPIQVTTKAQPIIPYIAFIAALTAIFTKLRRKIKRKR